jgi:exonuclease III
MAACGGRSLCVTVPEATTQHLLIDYVMLSPSLKNRIIQQPTIYAFDQDPGIGAADEHVSDHRPVFVEIDISPS